MSESDTKRPEQCETDGCYRDVRAKVDYYARAMGAEESGPTYRCEPCAKAFEAGSIAGRSDTTIRYIDADTKQLGECSWCAKKAVTEINGEPFCGDCSQVKST